MKDLETEKQSPLLMRYLRPGFSQHLRGRQQDIDRLFNDWIDRSLSRPTGESSHDAKARSTIPQLLKLTSSRRVFNLAYEYRLWGDFDLLGSVLTRARDEVAAWGGTLHFVYLPSRHPLFNDAAAVQRQVVAVAKHVGLPVVDIRQIFDDSPVDTPILLGLQPGDSRVQNLTVDISRHYGVEGNRVLGEAMLGAWSAANHTRK